jgi:4-carboxymuconolactone decarboxylase
MREGARIPPLGEADLNPAQLALLEAMVSGKRGQSAANGGPFGVWLHSPAFGMQVQRFGEYIRYDTNLDPAVSELLILCCAAHWRAQYEWYVHAPIATSSGVPDEVIEALRTGNDIPPVFAAEKILVRFARDALSPSPMPNAVYESLAGILSQSQIIEAAGLIGYYSLVAITLNVFDVPVPDPHFVGMV